MSERQIVEPAFPAVFLRRFGRFTGYEKPGGGRDGFRHEFSSPSADRGHAVHLFAAEAEKRQRRGPAEGFKPGGKFSDCLRARQPAGKAYEFALIRAKGDQVLRADGMQQARVVPVDGMLVQREVIGKQGDVSRQQRGQPLLH